MISSWEKGEEVVFWSMLGRVMVIHLVGYGALVITFRKMLGRVMVTL